MATPKGRTWQWIYICGGGGGLWGSDRDWCGVWVGGGKEGEVLLVWGVADAFLTGGPVSVP